MPPADPALIDGVSRIFHDLADPQTLNNASDADWQAPLWQALEQAGITRAWLPEDAGGAGASLTDGFAILRCAGVVALPVPLAETLLGGWLLARVGLLVPPGVLAVAAPHALHADPDGALTGAANNVSFATEADHVALLAPDGSVALVARPDCTVAAGVNLAGEPRNNVSLERAQPIASAVGIAPRDLDLMGAAARAAQMTGALEALLRRSVEYATERVAFGRPIGKFQAIQHELARLASETAAAIAASGAAAEALADSVHTGRFDNRVFMEVASAKIRVGEAAGTGAAIAHQVHGAIGFTEEHVLHRYTRRLWSWRDDFGAESHWAAELGAMVADGGVDAFWPTLTRQPSTEHSASGK